MSFKRWWGSGVGGRDEAGRSLTSLSLRFQALEILAILLHDEETLMRCIMAQSQVRAASEASADPLSPGIAQSLPTKQMWLLWT